jgi:hypothetical protein
LAQREEGVLVCKGVKYVCTYYFWILITVTI